MTGKEIEQVLRDYGWMVREIARLRGYLEDAGEGTGRTYEEMSLPKPKGGVSDPVYMEVARREKKWTRLHRLEHKILFVQLRVDRITEERQRATLDCMLDSMSISEIARHMGISERNVHRIKDDIVREMERMPDLAGMPDLPEMPDLAGMSGRLHN